ncbi:TetR family transcriptional regulator [Pseudomonas sp. StFLB209]|uniref:CerR family C-terminal domain-containing protein n=1 Tax=Pseudomonas sp. StFLB209 TaxID=1028989 RepID=UPI0004F7F803|nr:CerR family C-terminal domain-containing protein [Pseudomonas sp. StFLB209]BAP45875.1 TetR family transcriptional regulator [Pseudomonas sp. StFLB209]
MPRHKSTAGGGYQRGTDTRARLIETGLRLFGERGFEGASTRDIASEAGLNAPALKYYFDNKEGLYHACIEDIITKIREQLAGAVQHAEAVLHNRASSDVQLIEAYLQLLGGFIGFVQDSPQAEAWYLFMAREVVGLGMFDTDAIMHKKLYAPLNAVTTGLVGRLTGLPVDDERTRMRAFALNSQSMAMRTLRRQMLGIMEWDSVDSERMQRVREILLGQMRLTLRSWVSEREAGRLGASRSMQEVPLCP